VRNINSILQAFGKATPTVQTPADCSRIDSLRQADPANSTGAGAEKIAMPKLRTARHPLPSGFNAAGIHRQNHTLPRCIPGSDRQLQIILTLSPPSRRSRLLDCRQHNRDQLGISHYVTPPLHTIQRQIPSKLTNHFATLNCRQTLIDPQIHVGADEFHSPVSEYKLRTSDVQTAEVVNMVLRCIGCVVAGSQNSYDRIVAVCHDARPR
jgi:hypothetical protein